MPRLNVSWPSWGEDLWTFCNPWQKLLRCGPWPTEGNKNDLQIYVAELLEGAEHGVCDPCVIVSEDTSIERGQEQFFRSWFASIVSKIIEIKEP